MPGRATVARGPQGIRGHYFAISFSAANLLGLSRYARLDGKREIALLPGFVSEALGAT